jgi:uridine phosphorylase
MECAATIGIAAHFGVPAAGVFVLMDNLASQQTVLTLSDEDNRRIETGKDAILRASVAAVSGLVATRDDTIIGHATLGPLSTVL